MVTFPRNEIFDTTVATLPRPEYAIDIELFVVGLCDLLEFLIIKPTVYTFARQIYEFICDGNGEQTRIKLEDFVRPIAQITFLNGRFCIAIRTLSPTSYFHLCDFGLVGYRRLRTICSLSTFTSAGVIPMLR